MLVVNRRLNFIRKAKKIHNNRYDYSKFVYVDCSSKGIIICKAHGEFLQSSNQHLSGSRCKKCAYEDLSLIHRHSKEQFIKNARKVHKDKYDYSKVNYTNNRVKIIIICKTHGEFLQKPIAHLNGHGCPSCGGRVKLSKETFEEKARKIHGDKYDYSLVVYFSNKKKVVIICKSHGKFEQTPHDHLGRHGCPKCKATYLESKWLDFLNIPNDKKHRQVSIWIGNKRILADGYDSKTNTIYGFYGDFYHGNPKYYKPNYLNHRNKKTFGFLYEKTLEREKIIKAAGYNLVTIWENEFYTILNKKTNG